MSAILSMAILLVMSYWSVDGQTPGLSVITQIRIEVYLAIQAERDRVKAVQDAEIARLKSIQAAKIAKTKAIDAAKQEQCLAMNIYYEARSQSATGQWAIGLTTLKRVSMSNFPNSVCKVVYQRNWVKKLDRRIAQFSWVDELGTCETCRHIVPKDKKSWTAALNAAKRAKRMFGQTSWKADHYHRYDMTTKWSSRMKKTMRIGDHVFFQSDWSK